MPGKNQSPQWLLSAFDAILPPDAEKRKMFGHPAGWVNGHMFAMLVDEELGLRLSDEDQSEFLKLAGSGPFKPRGKHGFHGMVRVPSKMLKDEESLAKWATRSMEHVQTLPPKKSKKAGK